MSNAIENALKRDADRQRNVKKKYFCSLFYAR